jgi:hypothetical protein
MGKRNDVKRWFSSAMILAVGWKGNEHLVPLKNGIWLVAFMFDPYCTPNNTECNHILGINWMESVCALLETFYQSVQHENAVLEVYDLVLHMGQWGDEMKRRKVTIKPPENMELSSQIYKVIWQQYQMISVLSTWQLVGVKEFTLCANLVICLSILAVQSANVERVYNHMV